jgi:hypothetical protein
MEYQLAQLNIGRMLAPLNSVVMKDFVSNLDAINELAENSPGFVWRLKSDDNNATSIRIFDDDYLIVNMSVWSDKDALFDYVYRSAHVEIFKRKKEWFQKMDAMHMVLWYVPAGKMPTVEEALERLVYLRAQGATPYAFTFKKSFPVSECLSFVK